MNEHGWLNYKYNKVETTTQLLTTTLKIDLILSVHIVASIERKCLNVTWLAYLQNKNNVVVKTKHILVITLKIDLVLFVRISKCSSCVIDKVYSYFIANTSEMLVRKMIPCKTEHVCRPTDIKILIQNVYRPSCGVQSIFTAYIQVYIKRFSFGLLYVL